MPKTYSIVGTNFRGPEAVAYLKDAKPGVEVTLVREPTNKFDANAVQCWIGEICVGYIPKKDNVVLAQFIDQSGHEMAMDASSPQRGIVGRFKISSNSAFPQVEV